MIASLLLASLTDLPVFIGQSVGELLPASTPVSGGEVDQKLISGLLRIEKTDLPATWAGQPFSTADKLFLSRYPDADENMCFIGLPYATEEKYREVTLMIDDKPYKLRLPVTKSIGPNVRRTTSAKVGDITVTASFSKRRYSTESFRFSLVAKNGSTRPQLVGASWIPQKFSGPYRDALLGMGMVQLLEGKTTRTIIAGPPRGLGSSQIELKTLPVSSKPITLKGTRSSTTPYEYYLNGKKIYDKFRKLLPESGFDVLRVNNLYVSNFGISGRPPGNPPSYAAIKDGETFKAVGYKRTSSKPMTTVLKVDSPPLNREKNSGLQPGNIYIRMN